MGWADENEISLGCLNNEDDVQNDEFQHEEQKLEIPPPTEEKGWGETSDIDIESPREEEVQETHVDNQAEN